MSKVVVVDGAYYVGVALRRKEWAAYAAEHGLTGDWRRAHRYSLSRRELHAMYLEQEGCCYLCGEPPPQEPGQGRRRPRPLVLLHVAERSVNEQDQLRALRTRPCMLALQPAHRRCGR